MPDTTGSTAQSFPGKGRQFNFNKLQAALCIAASAAVSMALTTWAIRSFF